MKTLTSTKFVRSELTVETLASPKYGKTIRLWPKQKRNMTFEWYEVDMVFPVFVVINFV